MFKALFVAMVISMAVAFVLIRRLQEKPWTEVGVIPGSQDGLTSSAPKVGLWAFLGVVTSLFLVFIGAYFMRMDTSHGGIAAGHMAGWVAVDEPAILWLNSIVLILASIAIQLAYSYASKTDLAGMRRYFNTAGFLTMLFLVGQLVAWWQLYSSGNYGPGHPAFSFFVLLTAVHGLHLVGGLFFWSRTAARLRAGLEEASIVEVGHIRQNVQLCGTYWHYLLFIWIVLFALLLLT